MRSQLDKKIHVYILNLSIVTLHQPCWPLDYVFLNFVFGKLTNYIFEEFKKLKNLGKNEKVYAKKKQMWWNKKEFVRIILLYEYF